MKKCAKCAAEHDGTHSYCKPCLRTYQREWREKNPDAQRAYKRRWEAAHPEEVREAKRRKYQEDLEKSRQDQRRRRAANPEVYAAYAAKRKEEIRELGGSAYYRHRITLEQRAKFEADQGGKCPLCDRPLETQRVHVDHDHVTGLLRGLLCQSCNHRLGWYEKRVDLVARYLAGPHVPGAADIDPKRAKR